MKRMITALLAALLMSGTVVAPAEAGESREFVKTIVASALVDATPYQAHRLCRKYHKDERRYSRRITKGIAKTAPAFVPNISDGAKGAREALRSFCRR